MEMTLFFLVFNFSIALPCATMGVYLLISLNHYNALQLVQSNEQLIKTNSELDRFVYSTSHDLRAPLTSVMGLIDITQRSNTDPETKKYLMMMKDRCIHSTNSSKTSPTTRVTTARKSRANESRSMHWQQKCGKVLSSHRKPNTLRSPSMSVRLAFQRNQKIAETRETLIKPLHSSHHIRLPTGHDDDNARVREKTIGNRPVKPKRESMIACFSSRGW